MPTEGERVKGRKKVILPNGDTIYVPVITKISFIDPYERYQETEHSIDNTAESNRNVHADNVHPVPVDRDGVPTEDPPTQDTSQSLYVERIDTWHAVDPYERYQDTDLTLDNATGNDLLPPNFFNHEKTHIYRYHQDPQNPDDDGIWIDSELIDEFSVVDPYERYQEKHYTLLNPTNAEFRDGDLSGQASNDDADITIGGGDGEGTEDNPIRLDPFQNIVNWNGGFLFAEITIIGAGDTNNSGASCDLATAIDGCGTQYTSNTMATCKAYYQSWRIVGSGGKFISSSAEVTPAAVFNDAYIKTLFPEVDVSTPNFGRKTFSTGIGQFSDLSPFTNVGPLQAFWDSTTVKNLKIKGSLSNVSGSTFPLADTLSATFRLRYWACTGGIQCVFSIPCAPRDAPGQSAITAFPTNIPWDFPDINPDILAHQMASNSTNIITSMPMTFTPLTITYKDETWVPFALQVDDSATSGHFSHGLTALGGYRISIAFRPQA